MRITALLSIHCGSGCASRRTAGTMGAMKKLILAVGLLGVLTFACCAGMANRPRSGGAAGTTSAATPGAPSAPAASAYPIGQPFRLGEFTYVVQLPEVRRSIGGEFMRESASEGAVFLVVNYTEQNNGTETHTGLGSPFTIRDAAGRTFRPSSRAETTAAMSARVELIPELQPGVTHRGVTVFEVPAEDAHGALTIVAEERGTFNTGTAEIAAVLR
jgi:hypothetical protein